MPRLIIGFNFNNGDNMRYDYLVVGAGIIGLSIAKELNIKYPDAKIAIIEKENDVAIHASGRNSGVLHAGFYYTSNSLKAKFTKDGNMEIKSFCKEHNLELNESQKVVVAQNKDEVETIKELYSRGIANGVDVKIINEDELSIIDSNVKTIDIALFSPTTATVNPKEVTKKLADILKNRGVDIILNCKYIKRLDNSIILTSKGKIEFTKFINAAGLYADKIAKDFGLCKKYTIIPFKGIYLKYSGANRVIKTNIYPVPNLKNPFLGVHYTIMVDNTIKIGPTAIPALWRENYNMLDNFSFQEMLNILFYEAKLFLTNSFDFRSLAIEEIKKYSKSYLSNLSTSLVKDINSSNFKDWSTPGIRAQLLNTDTLELVQDFVVEYNEDSIHILNAVSPAFTCSFPFSRWVVDKYIV